MMKQQILKIIMDCLLGLVAVAMFKDERCHLDPTTVNFVL